VKLRPLLARTPTRCDLHVHSRFSTDSGNYALRRARLGESFTEPERVYRVARARGMDLVTISDHNTVEGALRIAHLDGTFLSVEVTTCFPEDSTPLHVLVWNLSEQDHGDLQPYRPSVYELVTFLRERGLVHALAHPLYRMGPPLTSWHVERMMLLFSIWEGRNGARPEESNVVACRLAAVATRAYLDKLAGRHEIEPTHSGPIALTGGSDDHGAIDIAATWTEATGETPEAFLAAVATGGAKPDGAHGSAVKLAHAMAALGANAYRESAASLSPFVDAQLRALFDTDADVAATRHAEIQASSRALVRLLGSRAREGGIGVDGLSSIGTRLASLAFAGGLELPYLGSAHHHCRARADVRAVEKEFFGICEEPEDPSAVVFTDTYAETNGVAGTMRRLTGAGASGRLPVTVITAGSGVIEDAPGIAALPADWSMPLPAYESIELRFPLITDVLERLEADGPDLVHVATPGPIGLTGLIAAKLLGIPAIGSYHTELGPYALSLTRDPVIAELTGLYVDWFYRQCDLVLAPTHGVMAALAARGVGRRILVWGRGVDTAEFGPNRRDEDMRRSLLDGGDTLLLSVGRVSDEKRLDVLLDAFRILRATAPGTRLLVVGDGPARARLEEGTPEFVTFLGELRGEALARLYASADIFCFPSTTDTFGQVILEAGVSGLPTVAVRAGGAAELVRDGETGLLVPPDDAAAFAEALARLITDPYVRLDLGEGALACARRRSWDRSFAELRDAYRIAVHGTPLDAPARIAA
jgi:glycosyltransferase involved in cell wall biosynthesis